MKQDATLSLRINSKLKSDVEEILDQLGINMTTAILMYFNQIKMQNGIPFNPVIPKPKTYNEYTEKELLDSINHSLNDYKNGNYYTLSEVEEEYNKK